MANSAEVQHVIVKTWSDGETKWVSVKCSCGRYTRTMSPELAMGKAYEDHLDNRGGKFVLPDGSDVPRSSVTLPTRKERRAAAYAPPTAFPANYRSPTMDYILTTEASADTREAHGEP